MFYPHIDDDDEHPDHADTVREVLARSVRLQEEVAFMEARGWVTRVIATRDLVGLVNGTAPEVEHLDYHLPWSCKPSAAMRTPRESLTWRKIRQDVFGSIPTQESTANAVITGDEASNAMAVLTACRRYPALATAVKQYKSQGFMVRPRMMQTASPASAQADETFSIEGIEYWPGKRTKFRDVLRAIPSAMFPQVR